MARFCLRVRCCGAALAAKWCIFGAAEAMKMGPFAARAAPRLRVRGWIRITWDGRNYLAKIMMHRRSQRLISSLQHVKYYEGLQENGMRDSDYQSLFDETIKGTCYFSHVYSRQCPE